MAFAEEVGAVLLHAMREASYREWLFSSARRRDELSAPERLVAADYSPDRVYELVGTMVVHEVLPVRVSERVWVVPSDSARLPPEVDIGITIEPGIAFGNGMHGTTRASLIALERWLRPGDRLVDLGTGSGILSIAAIRLGASSVRAFDTASGCVEAAAINFALNGVGGAVTVEHGSLDRLRNVRPPPDLIVANILTSVILDLLGEGLAGAVRPGGLLIVSGLLESHLPLVDRAAQERHLRRVQAVTVEGWSALVYRRPRRWLPTSLDRLAAPQPHETGEHTASSIPGSAFTQVIGQAVLDLGYRQLLFEDREQALQGHDLSLADVDRLENMTPSQCASLADQMDGWISRTQIHAHPSAYHTGSGAASHGPEAIGGAGAGEGATTLETLRSALDPRLEVYVREYSGDSGTPSDPGPTAESAR